MNELSNSNIQLSLHSGKSEHARAQIMLNDWAYATFHTINNSLGLSLVHRIGFRKYRRRAGFKKRGLKLTSIFISCIWKFNTLRLNALPHRKKDFHQSLGATKIRGSRAVHQSDVRNCIWPAGRRLSAPAVHGYILQNSFRHWLSEVQVLEWHRAIKLVLRLVFNL
jgi:hypothetical protein